MLRTGQDRQSAQQSPMEGWETGAGAGAGGGSPTQRPQQIFALI